ncbi:hypothetical protein M9H77_12479 [Catharanthus roseus]|uniref:Uncharacterized protein n=1 Tax=Catharanthus roseus TaxID=4058 RepID=A0ACC0BHJ6_CATRO|nr:hypothetical protein M9H77_12479 [Catharanthus roseus]
MPNLVPVKLGACAITWPSCMATLKLCDKSKLVVTSKDSAQGAGGEDEAILVMVCFILDGCCLVNFLGLMYPGVDVVGEGGTIPRATIFSITRGSSSLTREPVGRERSLNPYRFIKLSTDDVAVLEDRGEVYLVIAKGERTKSCPKDSDLLGRIGCLPAIDKRSAQIVNVKSCAEMISTLIETLSTLSMCSEAPAPLVETRSEF